MIDTPQIIQSPAQLIAFIPLTTPRTEIQHVMGPGIGELMTTVAAQGLEPTGSWFTHHLRMEPGIFDFRICVPVTKAATPTGRVQAGRMEAGPVARTVLHGPYEGLAGAWPQLDAWVAAQGRKPRPDLWEVYAVGPETSLDPSTWRTELNRPLEAA